jgi:hypothetical protein
MKAWKFVQRDNDISFVLYVIELLGCFPLIIHYTPNIPFFTTSTQPSDLECIDDLKITTDKKKETLFTTLNILFFNF